MQLVNTIYDEGEINDVFTLVFGDTFGHYSNEKCREA